MRLLDGDEGAMLAQIGVVQASRASYIGGKQSIDSRM